MLNILIIHDNLCLNESAQPNTAFQLHS